MARAPIIAMIALLVTGGAAIACSASDDATGGSSGGVSGRKRDPNAATGDLGGDPEAANDQTLNGGNTDESTSDAGSGRRSSDDAGASPDPDPDPDPIPTGSFAVGTELLTTANLNIRDGADTSYPIIATAPNGSTVMVVTVSGAGGWVNISWNGSVGWSSKAYLTLP